MRKKITLIIISLILVFKSNGQIIDSLYNQINILSRNIKVLNDSINKIKDQIEIQKKYFNPIDSVFKIRIWTTVKGNSGIIKEYPDLSSKVLDIKRNGDSILLVEYLVGTFNDRYFKLEDKGYIKDEYVNMTDKLYGIQQFFLDNKKKRDFEKDILIEKNNRTEYSNRKNDLVRKYGDKIAARILKNEIWLGMTSDMFLEVMGQPIRVNRTVTSLISYEQWVYGKLGDNEYYYFENKKLRSWQD